MMPFAFWKQTAALVTDQPPTEGLSYGWVIAPGAPGNSSNPVSNPNDVAMTITWIAWTNPVFGGPPPSTTIPPHGTANMICTGTGALGNDTTTGTWSTAYASGSLAGDIDCS